MENTPYFAIRKKSTKSILTPLNTDQHACLAWFLVSYIKPKIAELFLENAEDFKIILEDYIAGFELVSICVEPVQACYIEYFKKFISGYTNKSLK